MSDMVDELCRLLAEAGLRPYIAYCRQCQCLAHATGPCRACGCTITNDYGRPKTREGKR